MSKCEKCGFEVEQVTGKEKRRFCTDKCRKAFSRQKQGLENASGCPTMPELRTISSLTLDNLTPDSNSGQPITYNQFGLAGNPIRVSVPGDSDYSGCMIQDVSGNWIPKPKDNITLPPDDELFADLPEQLRINEDSPDWKKAPEYRQRIHHLKTTSIKQLESKHYYIPCWRRKMGNSIANDITTNRAYSQQVV